jgi:ABC-type spermidine/putrescine transport system permease subunit II
MRRLSFQAVATLLILLVCGGLVLYPVVFLVEAALNTGDPQEFPLQEWGLGNFAALAEDWHILGNTALVACWAKIMAILFGFAVAWILTRTKVPGSTRLERLMELPYYMTPLVGALAWAILASPRTGFLNQLWHTVGGRGDLFDIYSPFGIAWVMALFEGTVAFVMISAAMKSMDPSLEETSRVLGAGRLRTVLMVTLPLVMPGVLGCWGWHRTRRPDPVRQSHSPEHPGRAGQENAGGNGRDHRSVDRYLDQPFSGGHAHRAKAPLIAASVGACEACLQPTVGLYRLVHHYVLPKHYCFRNRFGFARFRATPMPA